MARFLTNSDEEKAVAVSVLEAHGQTPTFLNDGSIDLTVQVALTKVNDTATILGEMNRAVSAHRATVIEAMRVEHPEWFE